MSFESTFIQTCVSPVLSVILEKCDSLFKNERNKSPRAVRQNVVILARQLPCLEDLIRDADKEEQDSRAITNWVFKVKNVVRDLVNLVEEWNRADLNVRTSSLSIKHWKFCRRMAESIQLQKEILEEIKSDAQIIPWGDLYGRRPERPESQETGSVLSVKKILGRDEEREDMMRLLLDASGDLSVFSIVGICGIGKTTFTQWIYNDPDIQEYYEVRIWIYASADFYAKRLIRAAIASITKDQCSIPDLDPLQAAFKKIIAGKRILCVLDGVCSVDQEEWDDFKISLGSVASGSSVIVTTRLGTVASIMATHSTHFLKRLSDSHCMSLFKKRAFEMVNEPPPNLMTIGEEIVKNCGGIPWAANVTGGELRFSNEEVWLRVRDCGLRVFLQSSRSAKISSAFSLSYRHLPSPLREVFGFLSVYPKNYRIDMKQILHLWMANGWLQSREYSSPEHIGTEMVNALFRKSFFEDVERDEDGNIVSFQLHNIVHDIAGSIKVDDCCHVHDALKTIAVPRETQHLSVSIKTSSLSCILQSGPKLSTFIALDGLASNVPSSFKSPVFKSLRALSLRSFGSTTLPDSVGYLKQLRSLDVSMSNIMSLPESICGLRYLQRLILEECCYLRKLPKNLSDMINLRELNNRNCDGLIQMPVRMRKLTCLTDLGVFIVGSNEGRKINELQELNDLSKDLVVKGLENMKTSVNGQGGYLMGKKNLRSLTLAWSVSHVQDKNDISVIEALQPHQNMEKLFIEGYQGVNFPRWLEFSLVPSLVEICLLRCEQLLSLGGLANLKKLRIKKCPNLRVLNLLQSLESLELEECHDMVLGTLTDLPRLSSLRISCFSAAFIHFPAGILVHLTSLQSLYISDCKKLMELPTELGSLIHLNRLEISECDEIVSFPQELRNVALKSFSIRGCSNLNSFPNGLRHQTTLQNLDIQNCPQLNISTVAFQNLVTLETLAISSLHNLTSLPDGIGHVSTLRRLDITNCAALSSLPGWIQGLTNLENLSIQDCHADLHSRCEKLVGADWHKISHIQQCTIH